ncbi:MAG: cell division protein ZapA [Myxococcota bacterium]|nr:cell division protein ZapA [Myxococcota bacterium]
MERKPVVVQIRGREFRIRSEEDEESLQRIAQYLEDAMVRVEERTRTVDSLNVAILTGLNLARELVEIRDRGPLGSGDEGRLRSVIELAESALEGAPAEA